MSKRNIYILGIVVIVALLAVFGSRPFRASVNDEAGTASPHAIDQ
ncbi:hypothetical protein QTA58_13100 [Neorhizobium sp. CSC1952]|nr:hypothetical protein [Rhizobium sp. CSC1952]WJR65187.1 hypothetical protein QTA58_13100 [Rhizobium sp. CSC1952]